MALDQNDSVCFRCGEIVKRGANHTCPLARVDDVEAVTPNYRPAIEGFLKGIQSRLGIAELQFNALSDEVLLEHMAVVFAELKWQCERGRQFCKVRLPESKPRNRKARRDARFQR
jgi:hypothetical protein